MLVYVYVIFIFLADVHEALTDLKNDEVKHHDIFYCDCDNGLYAKQIIDYFEDLPCF